MINSLDHKILPINIDVIILSYAYNERLKEMTQNCIDSLIQSEDPSKIKFNVILIESNKSLKPFNYPNSHTQYPNEQFGYHRYINIGIRESKSPFICMCNNDLVFHKNWASEILRAMEEDSSLSSCCPVCPIHHPKFGIPVQSGNYYGYEVRREVAGWCIFFKRSILKTTGPLDEKFRFWYADNDYANTLKKHHFHHALITSSVVEHLESETLNTHNDIERTKLTELERFYYEYKWGRRNYFSYKKRVLLMKLKLKKQARKAN